MENCLITKLKCTVNNPDLPYIGSTEIEISPEGTGSLKVNDGQTAKLVSKTDGSVINLSASGEIKCSDLSETTHFQFVSVYEAFPSVGSTPTMSGIDINLDAWEMYEGTLPKISLKGSNSVVINIDKLPASNELTSFDVMAATLNGTISALIAKYPNIGKNGGYFNTYGVHGSFSGDISALGALKYIPRDFYISQSITGNFYDAIVGWRTNIGSTGTASGILCGANARLWSVYPGASKSFSLAWTPTTSSITVDGVTTTFDNSGNIV